MVAHMGKYWEAILPKLVAKSMSSRPLNQSLRVKQKWAKPGHSWVKVNCDGAWSALTLKGGYGWMIGDSEGWMLNT